MLVILQFWILCDSIIVLANKQQRIYYNRNWVCTEESETTVTKGVNNIYTHREKLFGILEPHATNK